MQQDNVPGGSRADIQPFRFPRSFTARPGTQMPVEYARPALPSWALALLAAALLLPFIGRAHEQALPARLTGAQAAVVPSCGPAWQVRRIGASSYAAHTAGMPTRPIPTACALPVDPGVALVVIHVSGDSAQVSTDLTVRGRMAVPAGSWWQVPVDRAHHTVVVTPDPYGGDTSVTIYAASQYPSADLP
jgi:hypothetical protein